MSPMCEKCWHDAHKPWISDPVSYYHTLLSTQRCTPEQQAGPDAGTCPKCKRRTIHQCCHVCTVCGWEEVKL